MNFLKVGAGLQRQQEDFKERRYKDGGGNNLSPLPSWEESGS